MTTASDDIQTKYVWKCQCEKFQIKLVGEPLQSLNCFCHSCVAPVRYMAEHHPGGTSAASPEGGAAFCLFELRDTFLPPPPGENGEYNVGYIRVGETGKSLRTYTKCCNSQLHMGTGANFPANFRPLNRNGVYKVGEDGSLTKYMPPAMNGGLKWKFDDVNPEDIPEPKHQFWPVGFILWQLSKITKYMVGMEKNPDMLGIKMIYAAPDDVSDIIETAPITW